MSTAPVFGSQYADLYDLFYRDKDYASETALLVQLFGRFSAHPIHRILDLGCGTGNHAWSLADRGFDVTGVDRSSEMLRVAQVKGQNGGHAGVKVPRFHLGSIDEVSIDDRFDAAIMMFAVLGYHARSGPGLEERSTPSAPEWTADLRHLARTSRQGHWTEQSSETREGRKWRPCDPCCAWQHIDRTRYLRCRLHGMAYSG